MSVIGRWLCERSRRLRLACFLARYLGLLMGMRQYGGTALGTGAAIFPHRIAVDVTQRIGLGNLLVLAHSWPSSA
jgi:hypothetical protein